MLDIAAIFREGMFQQSGTNAKYATIPSSVSDLLAADVNRPNPVPMTIPMILVYRVPDGQRCVSKAACRIRFHPNHAPLDQLFLTEEMRRPVSGGMLYAPKLSTCSKHR